MEKENGDKQSARTRKPTKQKINLNKNIKPKGVVRIEKVSTFKNMCYLKRCTINIIIFINYLEIHTKIAKICNILAIEYCTIIIEY